MPPRHIRVHWMTRPAICALSVVAGLGVGDLWLFVAGLLAAWFIDAKPWDPFKEGKIRERKSNDAPD